MKTRWYLPALLCVWILCWPWAAVAQTGDSPGRDARQADRGPIIELESRVTGNREQPQVFHVVPWQSPASPVPAYNPLDSQLRDVFGHLERDELQRQLHQSQHPSQHQRQRETDH